MGMSVGGKGGTVAEVNVVPLIDILLVLLVIFMIIPHQQKGLKAELPNQESSSAEVVAAPTPIIVQVQADGGLKINQMAVAPGELRPSSKYLRCANTGWRFYKANVPSSFRRWQQCWMRCSPREHHP
jgi:biopolymer transport protein TolR